LDCRTSDPLRRVAAAAPGRTRGAPELTVAVGADNDESARRDAPRGDLPACPLGATVVTFGVDTAEASSSPGAAAAIPAAGVAASANPRAKAAAPARAPRLSASIRNPSGG